MRNITRYIENNNNFFNNSIQLLLISKSYIENLELYNCIIQKNLI